MFLPFLKILRKKGAKRESNNCTISIQPNIFERISYRWGIVPHQQLLPDSFFRLDQLPNINLIE